MDRRTNISNSGQTEVIKKMVDLGFFRRQQLIEEAVKKMASSQGWEIKEEVERQQDSLQFFKDKTRYNNFYDVAEKIVDNVLAAINEDEDEDENS